jgi:hypothetical protein
MNARFSILKKPEVAEETPKKTTPSTEVERRTPSKTGPCPAQLQAT